MKQKVQFEIFSWIFSLGICALFLIPVYFKSGENYKFYIPNVVSIVVFIIFTRTIFLLGYTFFARYNWLRFVLVFLPIPIFMYLPDSLYEFQRFVDENGTIAFIKGASEMSDYEFGRFIKYQFMFFCVGALVANFAMPLRMIVSFWRTTNTKDKV